MSKGFGVNLDLNVPLNSFENRKASGNNIAMSVTKAYEEEKIKCKKNR